MNTLKSLCASVLAVSALASQAAVLQIEEAAEISAVFGASSPITFTGQNITQNPTLGAVSFASIFDGQRLGVSGGPNPNCPVGSGAICVLDAPSVDATTGRIKLASGGTATVVSDPDADGTPVLAGNADFALSYPIAMWFEEDVSGVAFSAGGFNAIGSTRVTLFDRNGRELISVLNPASSLNSFFTFAFTSSEGGIATNSIAGALVYMIAPEPEGFGIDDVRTVVASPTDRPGQIPEPGSLALVGLALLGLAAARSRKIAV